MRKAANPMTATATVTLDKMNVAAMTADFEEDDRRPRELTGLATLSGDISGNTFSGDQGVRYH